MLWKRALLQGKALSWEEDLKAEQPSAAALAAVRFILQIASQTSEFYLGGDDSPLLLQFLSAPSDAGDVDLVVTVLAPLEEGVDYLHTARGDLALHLCASFMDAFPSAPVLVQKNDGVFDYVLCASEGQAWTKGPVSMQRLAELSLRGASIEHRLAFFLPAAGAKASSDDAPVDAESAPRHFERFAARPPHFLD